MVGWAVSPEARASVVEAGEVSEEVEAKKIGARGDEGAGAWKKEGEERQQSEGECQRARQEVRKSG